MGLRYTIVGGRGFIGGALAAMLRERGDDVRVTAHTDAIGDAPLGTVIYASGIAAGAVNDAAYAFGAHVEGVRRLLAAGRFDRLVYLSSTRVYGASADTAEDAPLLVAPGGSGDVYRISKIAGEALCLAHPDPRVRVARLSNVAGASFGSPLFLSDIFRQAARHGRVDVRTTRAAAKDYIAVGDVCRYVAAIALDGRERLYNVATGENVANGAIYDLLGAAGVEVAIAPDAQSNRIPRIDVRRLHAEFGPVREPVLPALGALLERFTAHFTSALA